MKKIFILQMVLSSDEPVVIGAYDTISDMERSLNLWKEENPMYADYHHFFDTKILNFNASWTNDQRKA